jgi:hypothetical protein
MKQKINSTYNALVSASCQGLHRERKGKEKKGKERKGKERKISKF